MMLARSFNKDIAILKHYNRSSLMTGTMVQGAGGGVVRCWCDWRALVLFRLSRWEFWNMLRKFDQDVMGGVVR